MLQQIENSGFDTERKIEFIVPYSRRLTGDEIGLIVRRYIEEERKSLFFDWIDRPENRSFGGDIDAKKEELFRAKHRSGTILLGNAAISSALVEDLASRHLGSDESGTVHTDVLIRHGYDIPELEALIGTYNALPDDHRRFEFSKDEASLAEPTRYVLRIRRR